MNIDALLWAAARAFVQLTWFFKVCCRGVELETSLLPSQHLYILTIRCMRSYFGGGDPPQALVSVYNPGIRSAVCKNRFKSHTNLKETVNVSVVLIVLLFCLVFEKNVTAKHNLYKTSCQRTCCVETP